MNFKREVSDRLQSIHFSRMRIGLIPTLLVMSVSYYSQRDQIFQGHVWPVVMILLAVGTIARLIVYELSFEMWRQEVRWVRLLNIFAFFCTGLALGLHYFEVCLVFGPASSNAAFTLLMIGAFMSGASASMATHKGTYHAYVLPLFLASLFTQLYFFGGGKEYVVFYIIGYYIFCLTHFRLGDRQILDLVKAQVSSEQERDHLDRIINTVPGFVGIIDSTYVVRMANRTILNLYPFILHSQLGHLDPNSDWETVVTDFMKSDRSFTVFETRTVIKGEELWALINVQKTEDGGAIIVSLIITELVKARAALREHEAKSQYSAKLASLGEMAAGIAHEINNPLTIIQGSASIIEKLLDKEPLDKDNIKFLSRKMVETTERISKTVKSLKTLSRNGARDPFVRVNVSALLNLAMDMSGQRFKKHDIEFTMSAVPEDLEVLGREVELGQVLVNLINNAIDAAKEQALKWVRVDCEVSETWIDILVSDSGPGIPPEIRSKIMEPFFTTKEVNQGTGLGLSISKTIMESHQGELSLLAAPETTFRMRIPR